MDDMRLSKKIEGLLVQAKDEAYNNGKVEGIEEGRVAGHAEGLREGLEGAYADGREAGLREGRDEGRDEGQRTTLTTRKNCEYLGFHKAMLMCAIRLKAALPESECNVAAKPYWWGRAIAWFIQERGK
jgi:flagellar biosynthesis/type III secretory pathway protein FliH